MVKVLKSNIRLGSSADWVAPAPGTPPVVGDDSRSAVASGAAITITPLSNDSDPAGGELTVVGVETPELGTATIISDETQISYTPGADAGSDSFGYTVRSSASNLTATGTITVDVLDAGARQVDIETDRTNATNTAPAGFMFKATASGFSADDPKELRYKWNFDDPDAITLDALSADVFDVFGWRDSNVAYLDTANHVFATPKARFNGAATHTYTVTCTVTDKDGNAAQGSIEITVNNPDVTFSGTKTIMVAPDDDFTGAGTEYDVTGAQQFTDVDTALNNAGSTVRLLLKRGFTYAPTNNLSNKSNVQINAFGAGDPPIIDIAAGAPIDIDEVFEACVANTDYEGDWDARAESSPTGDTNSGCFGFSGAFVETYHTYYNCKCRDINDSLFTGGGNPVRVQDGNQRRHVYLTNIALDGFRNYGLLIASHLRFGATGFAIRQYSDAAQGNRSDKNGNAHTNMRFTAPTELAWTVIDGYEGFSCHGWTGTSSYESHGMPAPQSNLRWNPGYAKDVNDTFPSPLKFSRFFCEGGNTVIIGAVSYNPESTHGDIAFDKGVIVCGSTAGAAFGFGHNGCWVGNVIGIVPKMMFGRSKDFSPVFSVSGSGDHPGRLWGVTSLVWTEPVSDKHQNSSTPVDLTAFPSSTANKVVSGTVEHAPNLISPRDESANLDLATRLRAPKWYGMRFYEWSGSTRGSLIDKPQYGALDTFTQDGATQASVCLPVPVGTGLLAASADDVPVDDIFGNFRRDDPAGIFNGAVQPFSA